MGAFDEEPQQSSLFERSCQHRTASLNSKTGELLGSGLIATFGESTISGRRRPGF